jgi:Protein of unknown function (DUF3099)
VHHPRRERAHVVTEARPSMSDDIAYRQRRYLIMMGIRAVCFVGAVVLFVNHAGWLTAIPAVGAIIIPYFAVVFANGGREPNVTRGFRPYEPSLPAPYTGPPAGQHPVSPGAAAPGPVAREPGSAAPAPGADPGTPDANGAPRHNA